MGDNVTAQRQLLSTEPNHHPNIATTFDAGTAANGTAYIAMELVRGATLRQ
jgi:serine/threonine protein kinase